MACSTITLNGTALDCGSIGGLDSVYILPLANLDVIGFNASGLVTGLTTTEDILFTGYSFKKGNANFSSVGTNDEKTSTSYYTTTVNLQFNRMDTVVRQEVYNLCKTPSLIIALDRNNVYWLIGYGSYCVTNASNATGAQRGDANAFTLTITAETDELPFEVDNTVAGNICTASYN